MKAVVFTEKGKYEVQDVQIPVIKENEILVRNQYAGFCATDIHIYHGEFINDFPIIPGHEFSGIVEKVGKSVKKFKKGEAVVIYPARECGSCYYCKINQQNFCKTFGGYGVTFDGGSQASPQAHWVGLVLTTKNEDLANGILRMLVCRGNTAFDTLDSYINFTPKSVDILYEVVSEDNKDKAKDILLTYNLTEEESNNVLQ